MTPEERYFERFLRKSEVSFCGRVLDIGCGNGRFSRLVAETAESVEALDVERNAEWTDTPTLQFGIGDAEYLAYPSASFDVVLAMNMLHHTPNPERAIEEMVRVCRPDGQIILVEPNRWNPLGYVHLTLMGNHQHFPTKRFLSMSRALLTVLTTRQFECHCYPFPGRLRRVAEVIEDLLDGIPLWKPLIFYNVVIGRPPTMPTIPHLE